MSMMKPSRSSLASKGFTLLEIMVVVVIIGLLAAIVVPNFMGNVDTAAINRAKQDIRGIETALDLYRLDNFQVSELGGRPGGARRRIPARASAPNWKPQLRSTPIDPWNKPVSVRHIRDAPGIRRVLVRRRRSGRRRRRQCRHR